MQQKVHWPGPGGIYKAHAPIICKMIAEQQKENVHGRQHHGGDAKMSARKVIRDTPLVEVVLRKYEMPYETDDRELLKKFCLSLGLLQPGDSRDVIVDVLHSLLIASKKKKMLDSEEIRADVIELRKKRELPMLGIASSNIRRQIKRLRDVQIVEKIKNNYRITEFASLQKTFEEKVENFIIPSVISRIKEYFRQIDSRF